jgi:hypothetical protein
MHNNIYPLDMVIFVSKETCSREDWFQDGNDEHFKQQKQLSFPCNKEIQVDGKKKQHAWRRHQNLEINIKTSKPTSKPRNQHQHLLQTHSYTQKAWTSFQINQMLLSFTSKAMFEDFGSKHKRVDCHSCSVINPLYSSKNYSISQFLKHISVK